MWNPGATHWYPSYQDCHLRTRCSCQGKRVDASNRPPQNDHPHISPDAKAAEAKHQQVGLGPGPSWKRPAEGFHGACRHGNQTSAAGLQQSQERQVPFLSISQEPGGGGGVGEGRRGSVRTVKLSKPGWWGQGEMEVIFPLSGPVIKHQNVAPHFTPVCLSLLFSSLTCPAPSPRASSAVIHALHSDPTGRIRPFLP